MSRSIALQMDALEKLNPVNDSTLYVARAAIERGYSLFHYEVQNLTMSVTPSGRKITALGHALNLVDGNWTLGEAQTHDMEGFDVVFMRQDPPFDLAYISATHILEHLKKPRVVNDPVGVRNAPEKLLITHFPQWMPPTLISRSIKETEEFRKQHGDIVVKPLHGHAGHGIFHLKPGDDNLPALLETMAAKNNDPWMVQPFLEINKYGDKRIVMLDGEPVGSFTRFPAAGDMRGNMRVGARAEASPLTARDIEICASLQPVLREKGLFLAGIDVIGDYLTEINVTSPTGLATADRLSGRSGKDGIGELFWQKLFG